jgi:hypothetical protein
VVHFAPLLVLYGRPIWVTPGLNFCASVCPGREPVALQGPGRSLRGRASDFGPEARRDDESVVVNARHGGCRERRLVESFEKGSRRIEDRSGASLAKLGLRIPTR